MDRNQAINASETETTKGINKLSKPNELTSSVSVAIIDITRDIKRTADIGKGE